MYLIIGRTQDEDPRNDVIYGVCRSMQKAEEICCIAEAQDDEQRYYFWFPVPEIKG